jgi:hypothetical protein
MLTTPGILAGAPDVADSSIRQFLAQDGELHPYRAIRRLEAENGNRRGWIEAVTEYSPRTGFRYEITAEDGSSYIRARVLRAVLEGERDVIAQGDMARSALAQSNYEFQANGVDADGLVKILLSPKRREHVLVAGEMFLRPYGGDLVRLQGHLAKSPSFWLKTVHIVRSYDRIDGVVLPVELESNAQLRMFGAATLRMTYSYLEVDGRPIASARAASH